MMRRLRCCDGRVVWAQGAGPRALLMRPLSTTPEYSLIVPSMGDSISEGTIVTWQKKVGDYINADDVVVVLETDKVRKCIFVAKRHPNVRVPRHPLVPVPLRSPSVRNQGELVNSIVLYRHKHPSDRHQFCMLVFAVILYIPGTHTPV
jgi:hypothetical protein